MPRNLAGAAAGQKETRWGRQHNHSDLLCASPKHKKSSSTHQLLVACTMVPMVQQPWMPTANMSLNLLAAVVWYKSQRTWRALEH
jgi:hypothetical protein